MPSLLTLPTELQLKIAGYLPTDDLRDFALVHTLLRPVAQDYLFRSLVLLPSPPNFTHDVVFLVSWLQHNRQDLARRITSLRIEVADNLFIDAYRSRNEGYNRRITILQNDCEEELMEVAPTHILDKIFRCLPQNGNDMKESFVVGILLTLLPNLQKLDIQMLRENEVSGPQVHLRRGQGNYTAGVADALYGNHHRFFRWGCSAMHNSYINFQRTLDWVPAFKNLTSLILKEENYYMLAEASFPCLKTIDVKLPSRCCVQQEKMRPQSPCNWSSVNPIAARTCILPWPAVRAN